MVMKKAMRWELLREIANSKSRFISIFIMVTLSATFLTGLRSTSPDMRQTADRFFDEQKFMDLQVISTLGMTDADVEALAQVDGVSAVSGDWSLDALAGDSEHGYTVKLHSLSENGINAPVILEGTMPEAAGECAIEEALAEMLELEVGDTLHLEDTETIADALTTRDLTVTAIVESPLYISIDRGTGSLEDGSVKAYVLVSRDTFTLDYYTEVYLLAEGAAALDTYSTEYEELIDALTDAVTPVAEELAEQRYESLLAEGQEAIDDAVQEYEEAKQEAIDALSDGQTELDSARTDGEQQIADARQELEDARAELDQGWADLEEGRQTYAQEIADAEQQLQDAQAELERGEAELADSLTTLRNSEAELQTQQQDAQQQLEEARQALEDADAQIAEQETQLEAAQAQLTQLQEQLETLLEQGAEDQETTAQLQAQVDALTQTVSEGTAALETARAQTQAGWTAYNQQAAEAEAALAEARSTLDAGWTAYYQGQTELENGRTEYENGVAELEQAKIDGQQELDDAEAELTQGEQDYADGLAELEEAEQTLAEELADGQQELDDGWAEAEAEFADAEQQISDAEAELAELSSPTVYTLDRNYNAGYVGYDQDAERMAALANVFPLLFFIVAALVCLTTMTRMVEEERTQIGAIKALGYGTAAVAAKYLVYGALASLGGSLVGIVVGTKLIPYIICNAYAIMYTLPQAKLDFQWGVCLGSIVASLVCTLGATLWAVMNTMKETPAALMRPRSPKAGKRVFLEYIPFIWKRMNFSAKVCARNLLRYKKRFWMTVIGVGGCTALIITGLSLHNGIFAIIDRQYDELSLYNLQIGVDTDAGTDACQTVMDALSEDTRVEQTLKTYTNTVTFESDSRVVDGYLVSVEDQSEMEGMVVLREMGSGDAITIPEDGVVMSQKLSELLGISVGDTVTIESNGTRVEVRVAALCEHYVRHYIYMLDSYYSSLFGEAPEDNSIYVSVTENTEEAISAVAADMMSMEEVASATNIRSTADSFSESLSSVNIVVVVIILAAAALAFVVLYNLTNINITERIRELATIKVLGFFDIEVAMYVYRENFILTLLGVALGQVLGKLLYTYLIRTVEIDMVMFGREAVWSAYVGSIVLSLLFAVLVNFVMYFRLKRIDMVESLKSVE